MKIEGKVFEVVKTSDKVWTVVLRKKKKERIFPVAFTCFSYTIEAIQEQGIDEKDRVMIDFHPKSNKWKERYFTDLIVDKITLLKKDDSTLSAFATEYVDEETGEITEL